MRRFRLVVNPRTERHIDMSPARETTTKGIFIYYDSIILLQNVKKNKMIFRCVYTLLRGNVWKRNKTRNSDSQVPTCFWKLLLSCAALVCEIVFRTKAFNYLFTLKQYFRMNLYNTMRRFTENDYYSYRVTYEFGIYHKCHTKHTRTLEKIEVNHRIPQM